MRKYLMSLLVLLAWHEVSRWIIDRPSRSAESAAEEDALRTVGDLRAEFQDKKIPDSVYRIFQKAVQYHLDADYDKAERGYRKLKEIPRKSGGTFDLTRISTTLQHNMNQLVRDKARHTSR